MNQADLRIVGKVFMDYHTRYGMELNRSKVRLRRGIVLML